jgi:hypothetical protein
VRKALYAIVIEVSGVRAHMEGVQNGLFLPMLISLPCTLQQRTKASQKEDGQAFSAKRLEEVFNKYKEEGEDEPMIGTTGMEKFCQDLEIDPEDVRFLLHDFSATHLISSHPPPPYRSLLS